MSDTERKSQERDITALTLKVTDALKDFYAERDAARALLKRRLEESIKTLLPGLANLRSVEFHGIPVGSHQLRLNWDGTFFDGHTADRKTMPLDDVIEKYFDCLVRTDVAAAVADYLNMWLSNLKTSAETWKQHMLKLSGDAK